LGVVLGARLGCDGAGDFAKQLFVKRCRKPIACGKTVAVPARATPCSASFHHL
jgi:hypothetical protein